MAKEWRIKNSEIRRESSGTITYDSVTNSLLFPSTETIGRALKHPYINDLNFIIGKSDVFDIKKQQKVC